MYKFVIIVIVIIVIINIYICINIVKSECLITLNFNSLKYISEVLDALVFSLQSENHNTALRGALAI